MTEFDKRLKCSSYLKWHFYICSLSQMTAILRKNNSRPFNINIHTNKHTYTMHENLNNQR